jgi:hypothetical protein
MCNIRAILEKEVPCEASSHARSLISGWIAKQLVFFLLGWQGDKAI